MTLPIFHDSWQSSAAWRVRAALALKRLPHDVRMHEIIGNPHRTPAFLALNPQGTVPVMEIDEQIIPQSLAIIEYLDETRTGRRLLPKAPSARARVRILLDIVAMETHVVTNMDVALDATRDGDALRTWQHRYVRRGFDALEAHLEHPATGRFCHGDSITMADCCLVPQARNAETSDLEIGEWPRIESIYRACLDQPEFSVTHPERVAPTTEGVTL